MLIARTPASDFGDTLAVAPPGDSALPVGSRLRDYEIIRVIAEGDFAIVYLARDHSLQRMVAVKEYLPIAMASRRSHSAAIVVEPGHHAEPFDAGLKSFVAEARLLARFDHPSLVKVYRFWEDNGTAYMVMPFYEGPTLKTALAELGHVPGEGELRTWLRPILNAVAVLHEGQTWHQNIGPGEIVLTPTGPVLLGFGAAARAIGNLDHGPASALKPGFAALEQYGIDATTAVGPWTDLYGLAAVLYDAIAGAPPQPAPERLAGDTLQPLLQVAAGLYSTGFLAAIDAALAVRPAERSRGHEQFRAAMGNIAAPVAPVSLAPARDLMLEPFLRDTSSYREITVPDRPLLQPTEPPPVKAPGTAELKARAAAIVDDDRVERPGAGAAPAWMSDAGQGGNGLGKRALFGVVAAIGALVGVGALALNFYLQPAAKTPLATPAAASAVPTTTTTSLVVAPDASASRPVPVPASITATAPTSSPMSPAVAPTAATAASAASATTAVVPSGQTTRCIDILQKASLEPISAADTEFFKKECK